MKTKRILFFLPMCAALVAATGLAGCGSGGAAAIVNSNVALSKSVTTANGLLMTLTEDRAVVSVGQNITYTLTIKNVSSTPVNYTPMIGCIPQLITGIESSVGVSNTAGTVSTQLYNGTTACGAIGFGPPTSLAPGASLSGTVGSGRTFSRAGTYEAAASVATIAYISGASGSSTAEPITVGTLTVVVTN